MLPVSRDFIERIKRTAFSGDDVIGGLPLSQNGCRLHYF